MRNLKSMSTFIIITSLTILLFLVAVNTFQAMVTSYNDIGIDIIHY